MPTLILWLYKKGTFSIRKYCCSPYSSTKFKTLYVHSLESHLFCGEIEKKLSHLRTDMNKNILWYLKRIMSMIQSFKRYHKIKFYFDTIFFWIVTNPLIWRPKKLYCFISLIWRPKNLYCFMRSTDNEINYTLVQRPFQREYYILIQSTRSDSPEQTSVLDTSTVVK